VSSAGEQLASNKIYDGENTRKGLSKRKVFSLLCFHCPNGLKKLISKALSTTTLSMNKIYKNNLLSTEPVSFPGCNALFIFYRK
jgi:hypothetical protein